MLTLASIPRGNLLRLLLCRALALHSFREQAETRRCTRCGRHERLADEGGGHDGPVWIAAAAHQLEKPAGGE